MFGAVPLSVADCRLRDSGSILRTLAVVADVHVTTSTEALTFDKDDESDRELLREDPYAEYIDFPQECRMKDETQAELICY